MTESPKSPRSGHGRGRSHRTRRSVKFADVSARTLITVGGIGTIAAVCGVFLFLVWVVKDLFLPAKVGDSHRIAADVAGEAPVMTGCDEYRTMGWTVSATGTLRLIRLDDGTLIREESLIPGGGPALTAWSMSTDGRTATLGFEDGSLRFAEIGFETAFREVDEVPAELRGLQPEEVAKFGDGTVERTTRGQFRIQRLVVDVGEPVTFPSTAPVVAIDRAMQGNDPVVAIALRDGKLFLRRQKRKLDFLTGKEKVSWDQPSAVSVDAEAGSPRFIRITDLGNQLSVCWSDGTLVRYSIRDLASPKVAEIIDLVPGEAQLTALGVLLGGSTLITGSSDGRVAGWFVVPDTDNEVDGTRLVCAHRFTLEEGSAVTAIASSPRERMFVVGTRDGFVHALFMTSEKWLASLRTKRKGAITALAVAPKNDALLAADAGGLIEWPFDPRYPEVTVGALFGKVWYERFPEPEYTWQSSSGTDDFEPKLSLVPLVFGTIKATVYSMLLAVPLALLAAIYTSEFLHRKTRARVKPIIELMASLPSVVLGFFAAIVIAPMVREVLPAILASLIALPFALLLSAFLWQWIPIHRSLRMERLRLPMNALALVLGLVGSWLLGPALERLLFAGDVIRWLHDPSVGTGLSGWFLLMLPLSAIAVTMVLAWGVNPWIRRTTAHMGRSREGLVHLAKFGGAFVLFVGLALALGAVIYHLPQLFDPANEAMDLRTGLYLGKFDLSPIEGYDQRNALIVGFVMGFAVVPIIYTIAEDALSSVPEHLRAASLGAGATPWQTAVRVIIPTAMSGLFSACMVGLGRAVGETMIVFMATGNTALLKLNAFNGFRTLSANIAIELPEAVRDSTHYRTLFLAALVLFAMTFVINTVAEAVRLRFRRRAYQL